MQAEAQDAAPETTMLPDAPEQHLDEYPMPDPALTQDDLEKCGYLDGDLPAPFQRKGLRADGAGSGLFASSSRGEPGDGL